MLRASTVARLLIEDLDISANRVLAAGKGAFSPMASNETAEGRARNRRIEIVIKPRQDLLVRSLLRKIN